MIDLFRIPTDFPGFEVANKLSDPMDRASQLEASMLENIVALTNTRFFVPYVQMYEFEALLWTSPETLDASMIGFGAPSRLTALQDVRIQYATPEHINNGPETAPSKRLEKLYGTAYNKKLIGPLVTQRIGLEQLREACLRFGAWITRLENLG